MSNNLVNQIDIEPALKFQRTKQEINDPFFAWQRDDTAFFAAGGCHILAHMFISLHLGEGFELVSIKPRDGMPGNHIFASNGTQAFDFNGWSLEKDLLEVNEAYAQANFSGWDFEKIIIKEGLVEYLKHSNHLRPPEYFPELPWKRAYDYCHRF